MSAVLDAVILVAGIAALFVILAWVDRRAGDESFVHVLGDWRRTARAQRRDQWHREVDQWGTR